MVRGNREDSELVGLEGDAAASDEEVEDGVWNFGWKIVNFPTSWIVFRVKVPVIPCSVSLIFNNLQEFILGAYKGLPGSGRTKARYYHQHNPQRNESIIMGERERRNGELGIRRVYVFLDSRLLEE